MEVFTGGGVSVELLVALSEDSVIQPSFITRVLSLCLRDGARRAPFAWGELQKDLGSRNGVNTVWPVVFTFF